MSWLGGKCAEDMEFEVVADTEGWLGFGFSRDGSMPGAGDGNLALITSTVSGRTFASWHAMSGHSSSSIIGASQPLPLPHAQLISAEQVDGTTRMKLQVGKAADNVGCSASPPEAVLCADGPTRIIMAYHTSNSFNFHGGNWISVALSIDGSTVEIEKAGPAVSTLIIAHAVLMAVAWLICAPCGVCIKRHVSGPLSFKTHMGFQICATMLTITGLVLAVKDRKTNFKVSAHTGLGLALIGVVIVQAVNGLARPAKKEGSPHTNNDSKDPQALPGTLRTAWEFLHKSIGWLLLIAGLVNCLLGSFKMSDRADKAGDDAAPLVVAAVVCVWIGFFLVFEVCTPVAKRTPYPRSSSFSSRWSKRTPPPPEPLRIASV